MAGYGSHNGRNQHNNMVTPTLVLVTLVTPTTTLNTTERQRLVNQQQRGCDTHDKDNNYNKRNPTTTASQQHKVARNATPSVTTEAGPGQHPHV